MDRQLPYRSRAYGTKRGRGGLLVVAASLALAIAVAPAASQESGTVTGVVTDETTGQLLEGTRVTYDGGAQMAVAVQTGRYVLANIPAGTHTLNFELIGYESVTVELEVVGGATTERNIAMVSRAIPVQELVVSGVARATPKAKLPIVVERLDAEDLPVPATSTESLLAAKLPGVKVVRGSGQPGVTGDILLRGATSITGSQSALVVIDGVITGTSFDDLSAHDIESIELVKGAAGASLYGSRAANGVIVIRTKRGIEFTGQDYRRIVARNEFGGDQLPGTIQLSKYHPWLVENGCIQGIEGCLEHFPDSVASNPIVDGDSEANAFQDNPWPLDSLYDHVDRVYSTGMFMSNYVATEGRDGNTSYRMSLERNDQRGVLSKWHDGFQRRGFRLNLDHAVRDNLSLSVSTAYNHLDREDIGANPFYRVTFTGPYVDLLKRDRSTGGVAPCPEDGCYDPNPDPLVLEQHPLYRFELIDLRNKQKNQTANANVVWRPFSWMDMEGNFGFDTNVWSQTNYTPEGLVPTDGPPELGGLSKEEISRTQANSDLTLSMSRAFGDLSARTRLRYLQEVYYREQVRVSGEDFTAEGVPRIDNLDPATLQGESSIREILSEGLYAIFAFDYLSKYIADGVIRYDRSSLFGKNVGSDILGVDRLHRYWRFAGAWRPSQEAWWPLPGSDVKLRAALGTAGRRPCFTCQYETLRIDGGQIVLQNLGNPNLKPQRSAELEAGVDLVVFDDVTAEITYARTISRDQILEVPLASPTGYTRQIRNAGVMSNNTWEMAISAPIIAGRTFDWNVRLNADRTRQRIDSLYYPAWRSDYFYYAPGVKFGSFYGQRWAASCDDLPVFSNDQNIQNDICATYFKVNDDGLLVYTGLSRYTQGISDLRWGTKSDEDTTFIVTYDAGGTALDSVTVVYDWGMPIPAYGQDPRHGDRDISGLDPSQICNYNVKEESGCSDLQYMGNTTPDFNISLANTFRWKGLRLYALLDGEFGAQIYNLTRQWAYRDYRSGDQDQFGKADSLKKPMTYYSALYNTAQLSSWFVEAGDFIKLRELSLTYSVPPRILDRFLGGQVSQLDIDLIGRNLLTFTNYSGYDPEVGRNSGNEYTRGDGGSTAIGRIDTYQYPNYRTISASVRMTF